MTAVAKREKPLKSRDYKAFIRSLPCIQCMIEGRETYGCDPAHVSHAFPGWTARGKSEKVGDDRCLPSCRVHHDEQHADGNERRYWAAQGVNPVSLCAALAAAFPDAEAGAAVILEYRGGARSPRLRLGISGGPVTRRPAGPTPVTITAHLCERPADEHGNVAVLIPRERGGRDTFCDIVWVAPTTITSEGAG